MMLEKKILQHEEYAACLITKQPRTLLFDAMGVGKTVSVLESLKQASVGSKRAIKAIVCVPNTIVGQWVDEASVWLNWDCVVSVCDAGSRSIKYEYFKSVEKNCLLITNYHFIMHDSFFNSCSADFLILDEGYLFRNNYTKLYSFLKSFVKRFQKVVVLSGNYESLTKRQFENIAGLLFDLPEVAKCSKDALVEFLGTSFISRTLEEVDLGVAQEPKINLIPQQISKSQKEMLADVAIQENKAKKNQESYSPVEFYNLRKMILNSPRIFDSVLCLSPKEEFVLDFLSKTKDKVVVYCPDAKFFKLLKSDFNCAGIKFVYVNGSISIEQRKRSLNLFRLDPEIKCLIISGVGKFGLNLQVSHLLVCMCVPKQRFDLDQMLGRMIRLNQDKQVECFIPYHEDSQEVKNVERL